MRTSSLRSFFAVGVAGVAIATAVVPRRARAESPAALPNSTVAASAAVPHTVARSVGPAGSLVLVEPDRTVPIVHVVVALRSGSGSDPHKKDGLTNLAGELARRGAAGRSRKEIDARLDALGATLDVITEPDALRFEGHVLSRHIDDYLALVADIVLAPDFPAVELGRTRRDILAGIEELRNDDRTLCGRFFIRNLYSDHPYGHSAEGDAASLARVRREDLVAFHRRAVVGPNVIFAAAGDVAADQFGVALQKSFAALPKGNAPGPDPLVVREPQPPRGWRIQIVDKPERKQVQVMFGQLAVRAADPDFVPLLVAFSSFGGEGMEATLMNELRARRGLAYGAYMGLSERLGRGAAVGWFFSTSDKVVPTLKLALRLYVAFMDKGIDDDRLAFAKTFLAGTLASDLDDPARRLNARVTAEIAGLPSRFVDELPARIRVVTGAEARAAIARHVRAHDLAITAVGTARDLAPRLIDANVRPSAVDVVPYDGY